MTPTTEARSHRSSLRTQVAWLSYREAAMGSSLSSEP